MQLSKITDKQLLSDIQKTVQDERQLLTKVLHHLREIDRRKLYSELGYRSLFDYVVKELKYSEGQAGRRIQAMRLIKELPQVEKSIASGELSLSNISQAQSAFRTAAHPQCGKPLSKSAKLSVLTKLKNKSSREAQKELLKIIPEVAPPTESERPISESETEVRFIMSDKLKEKLETVRSLLGTKGSHMNYAQLFEAMTELSITALQEKRFGKKRAQTIQAEASMSEQGSMGQQTKNSQAKSSNEKAQEMRLEVTPASTQTSTQAANSTAAQASIPAKNPRSTPAVELKTVVKTTTSKNNRYISKALQAQVWQRDKHCCSKCGGRRNLQIDHMMPVAKGGKSVLSNLRLLCFHCNQRAAMNAFGIDYIKLKQERQRYS